MSKITRFASAVVLSMVVLLGAGPLPAQAASLTGDQINAIIGLLQSFGADSTTVANVNAALGGSSGGGGPQPWCHTFNKNLGIGNTGNEVAELIMALQKEGFMKEYEANFDEQVSSAVTGFQQKYSDEILTPNGLKYGTGYVGKATRSKLNELYGCGVVTPPTSVGRFDIVPTSELGTLKVGDSITLKALYYPPMPPCPSGYYCDQVMPAPQPVEAQWSIGSADVLRVTSSSPNPLFTASAVGVGTTYINASYDSPTTDKTFKASVTVVVGGNSASEPKIYITGISGNQSSGTALTIGVGSKLTISGTPTGLGGASSSDYSRAFFFDPIFDGSCTNNSASDPVWIIECTARNMGTSRFYIEIYQNGKIYQSNTITVTVSGTAPQPSITVLSPNGGEQYPYGAEIPFKWTENYTPAGAFTLLILDVNAGKYIYSEKVPALTNERTIPPQSMVIPVGKYKLEIHDDGAPIADSSDASFSVAGPVSLPGAPSIASIVPSTATVGGTVYVYGTNFNPNTFVALDGPYGQSITPTLISPISLSFVVPSSIGVGAHTLQVNEKGASFPLSNSVGLNVVGAAESSFVVLSPNGGEQWTVASTQTVRWKPGMGSAVHVQLISPDGVNSYFDKSDLPNSGSFVWTIPPTLSPGSYKIRVGCITTNCNTSTNASFFDDSDASFTITGSVADVTPPTAPQNLAVAVVSPTQVNLSWSVSADNVGVVGYKVYRNGVHTANTLVSETNTSHQDTGLSSQTTYSYSVSAYDAAGNVSVSSSPVTVATPATTTPTASFSLTADKTSVSTGGSLTIQWSNTAAPTYAKDWIALIPAGTTGWPGSLPWFYTNGASSGSQTMQAPSTPGTYDLAYYQNNSVTVWKRGGQVQVTGDYGGASALSGFERATNIVPVPIKAESDYTWNRDLQFGSSYTSDVSALQSALSSEGLYTGEITGGFYSQTYAAVKRFQEKYGIESTGFVGPETRAKLNALY